MNSLTRRKSTGAIALLLAATAAVLIWTSATGAAPTRHEAKQAQTTTLLQTSGLVHVAICQVATATVVNYGDMTSTFQLSIVGANGKAVAQQTATVDPGQTATLTYTPSASTDLYGQ